MVKRIFIAYLNDDDLKVQTNAELLEQEANYVKIMVGASIITLPYHRILKMKELIG